jgi:hypothetical protein
MCAAKEHVFMKIVMGQGARVEHATSKNARLHRVLVKVFESIIQNHLL